MSKTNQTEDPAMGSELDSLKKKAKIMGIKHHHNIGVVKLQGLIADHINKSSAPETPQRAPDEVIAPDPLPTPRVKAVDASDASIHAVPAHIKRMERANNPRTPGEKRAAQRKEAGKLIRIRVNCMNPNKKDWEGEMYTVSNAVVGTFKKYVPFNNDQGWHVPNIIYKHMEERQCQIFYTFKNELGHKVRKGKLVKELAIEVMPPLTQKELDALAQRQMMAAGKETSTL